MSLRPDNPKRRIPTERELRARRTILSDRLNELKITARRGGVVDWREYQNIRAEQARLERDMTVWTDRMSTVIQEMKAELADSAEAQAYMQTNEYREAVKRIKDESARRRQMGRQRRPF